MYLHVLINATLILCKECSLNYFKNILSVGYSTIQCKEKPFAAELCPNQFSQNNSLTY